MSDLYSEFELKGKTIKNRLVFPPIVCFNYALEDGMPTERNMKHYGDYINAGIGLIIVEATCISPHGKLHSTQLGIWDDRFIDQFQKITQKAHENGSLILMQIHHAGLITDRNSTALEHIFSPSGYTLEDGTIIREITEKEIEQSIVDFKEAAVRCVKAGFDGVEIHGAHGYLISQFMSPTVNKRTDIYGKDKGRYGVEVIKAIKEAVPDDFIIAMRMGASDPDLTTSTEYARQYVAAGVDLLHISTGFMAKKPDDFVEINVNFSWITQLGIHIKKSLPDTPVIAVYGIDSPAMADDLIKSGGVDFAASARGLLSDPQWLQKYKNQIDINPCLKCKSCSFRIDGANCPARKKLKYESK